MRLSAYTSKLARSKTKKPARLRLVGLVTRIGFKPMTCCLEGSCSILAEFTGSGHKHSYQRRKPIARAEKTKPAPEAGKIAAKVKKSPRSQTASIQGFNYLRPANYFRHEERAIRACRGCVATK